MILGKNKQDEIINKPVSADADQFAKNCIDEFSESLLWQAKSLAYQRKNEMVLREHIEESLRIAQRQTNKKWFPEIIILLGGIFAGTFIQGVASELLKKAADINTFAIAIFIVMGVVGMLMVFWGFWKNYNS